MEKTVQRALLMVVIIGLLLSVCEGRRRPNKEISESRNQGGGCSGDLIFMTCGGCTPVCGEPLKKCSRMCHIGCKCPRGLSLRSKGSDVCVKECPGAIDANIAE